MQRLLVCPRGTRLYAGLRGLPPPPPLRACPHRTTAPTTLPHLLSPPSPQQLHNAINAFSTAMCGIPYTLPLRISTGRRFLDAPLVTSLTHSFLWALSHAHCLHGAPFTEELAAWPGFPAARPTPPTTSCGHLAKPLPSPTTHALPFPFWDTHLGQTHGTFRAFTCHAPVHTFPTHTVFHCRLRGNLPSPTTFSHYLLALPLASSGWDCFSRAFHQRGTLPHRPTWPASRRRTGLGTSVNTCGDRPTPRSLPDAGGFALPMPSATVGATGIGRRLPRTSLLLGRTTRRF